MNKLLITVSLALVAATSVVAQAQQPIAKEPATSPPGTSLPANSGSAVSDWQLGYHTETGREYVRRRAQERSAARQARIEGMKWLGHSPSRPVLSATPFMSNPPAWVGVHPTGNWWGWNRPAPLP